MSPDMDPFKLLTKGTNLSKATGKTTPIIIPSSGPVKTAQTSFDRDISEHQSRGIKRKRNDNVREHEVIQSETAKAPDFFHSGAGESSKNTHSVATAAAQSQALSGKVEEIPFSPKSEAECKQVLKRHKLRINMMNPPSKKAGNLKSNKSNLLQLVPQPLSSFSELQARFHISKRLAENISEQGYSTPTGVQLAATPIQLGDDRDRGLLGLTSSKEFKDSHVDLLSIAPTGSGKTLAFLIPLIQGILDFKHQVQDGDEKMDASIKAIILAPTHELADQIVNEARKLIQRTGLRVTGMRKGMHVLAQEDSTDSTGGDDTHIKADILVSTPLALVNAISNEASEARTIPSIRYLVLDEADVLLDPLFRDQTLLLWKACTNKSLRVSLWSATIGASIESLAKDFILSRRKELDLPKKHHYIIRLIAGLKDSALPTVSHRLIYAATEQGKLLAIRQILHPTTLNSGPTIRPPFLIFTQTIPRATALHSEMLYDIPTEAGGSSRIAVLHSSLSDTMRSDIMARFRKGEIWILITTDLLSRGVDFRGINGIVNYDIPTTSAAYVHRAGRTGRAGRKGGVAITLYTKEDIPYVKNVANVIAASDRAHGKIGDGEGIPQWLLNSLPDVSKKTKKDLKKHGVEERRNGVKGPIARISTKSGFQRREDNRKRGAREASTRRASSHATDTGANDDSEWSGIQD